jgi:hypothetical protein
MIWPQRLSGSRGPVPRSDGSGGIEVSVPTIYDHTAPLLTALVREETGIADRRETNVEAKKVIPHVEIFLLDFSRLSQRTFDALGQGVIVHFNSCFVVVMR